MNCKSVKSSAYFRGDSVYRPYNGPTYDNPDHKGYFERLTANDDICRACVKCNKSWSAGMDLSCHDNCNDYQKWKGGL